MKDGEEEEEEEVCKPISPFLAVTRPIFTLSATWHFSGANLRNQSRKAFISVMIPRAGDQPVLSGNYYGEQRP